MRLAIYVHDLKLEIGHSNSLIELLRHLPQTFLETISELEIVSCTTAPPEELFPKFRGRVTWTKVPFGGMKPVLAKSLFFQLWTAVYNQLFQKRGTYRIGIGISCLDVDAISIQFIHHQWTRRGLELEQGHLIRKLYKKILFGYFELCENFLFRRSELKVFSPAKFLTEFIESKNPKLQTQTIYSGVNLGRFELAVAPKEEVLRSLTASYPVLKGLDVTKPVYLFVGAYERKGLSDALALLQQEKGKPQFIVIGSPSLGRAVEWPPEITVFPVTFTREVPKFYALADAFIFPTMYEPFGLVLFEAMAMGLTIVTRRKEVGASELLEGLPEVYFCDEPGFRLPRIESTGFAEKAELRERRLKALGKVSWDEAGSQLAIFLSSEGPGTATRSLTSSAPPSKS